KLSLHFAFVHKSASPVWMPTGLALAALLLLGYRVWPAIFAGAFLVNFWTTPNLLVSLGIASGNTLEALCGAWLIYRFANGAKVFDRTHDVFKFAAIELAAAAMSASIGVSSLCFGRLAEWSACATIWKTWWLGDFTAALIVTP